MCTWKLLCLPARTFHVWHKLTELSHTFLSHHSTSSTPAVLATGKRTCTCSNTASRLLFISRWSRSIMWSSLFVWSFVGLCAAMDRLWWNFHSKSILTTRPGKGSPKRKFSIYNTTHCSTATKFSTVKSTPYPKGYASAGNSDHNVSVDSSVAPAPQIFHTLDVQLSML